MKKHVLRRPARPAPFAAALLAATALSASVPIARADPAATPAAASTAASAPPAPKPIPVAGTVQAPDGKPVAGAVVTLAVVSVAAGDSKARTLIDKQTAVTQADGAYSFTLPVGMKPAPVKAVLWASTADSVGVASSWARPGTPQTLVLRPRTRVRVRLTGPDGAPLAGVRLEPRFFLLDRSGGSWDGAADPRWTVTTGSDGWATLAGLPQGMAMVLNVLDERYTEPGPSDSVALAAAPETPDKVLRLQAGSVLTGRVLYGPAGPAAPDVSVAVSQNGASYFRGDAETDADGRYRLTRLPPGDYSLTLGYQRPGAEQWTTPLHTVTVPAGAAAAGPDIVLVKGGLLTGLVTDRKTGKPLPGIRLVVTGPAHPADSGGADSATTGPDGRYSLRVPPGVQTVYPDVRSAEDGYLPRNATVADGQTVTADFRVTPPEQPVAVHGVVLGPDGGPVAGAEVLASVSGGQEVVLKADAQGRFAFDQPGLTSTARLYARAGELGTQKAAAPASAVTLHLAAGALCSLQGRVTGPSGRSLPGVKVALVRWTKDGGGADVDAGTADAQGRYTFGHAYGDVSYSVRAEAPGYAPKYSDQAAVAAGRTLAVPVLKMARTDSFVGGTVLDPSGRPVAGARVRDEEVTSPGASAVTDAKGRFHLAGVPGPKTPVEVRGPEERWASVLVTSGRDDNVIRVQNRAEQDEESRRYVALRDADKTNHGDGRDANALLASARSRAAAGGKKVLLVFHASWCGPCFMFHRFLTDPQIRPVIEAHFVVQDLDIWEHEKNGWENPGGAAIDKHYGGPNSIPFYVVTDAAGRKLGDGMHHGENMGMPTDPDDVAYFLGQLKAACPSISPAELKTLKDGLVRHANL